MRILHLFFTQPSAQAEIWNQVLQKVSRMLGDKIDVKKEIEATLAAKKSEQMIMSLMPAGIICISSDDFPWIFEVFFMEIPLESAAMTVSALAVYAVAYWLGRKDRRY